MRWSVEFVCAVNARSMVALRSTSGYLTRFLYMTSRHHFQHEKTLILQEPMKHYGVASVFNEPVANRVRHGPNQIRMRSFDSARWLGLT